MSPKQRGYRVFMAWNFGFLFYNFGCATCAIIVAGFNNVDAWMWLIACYAHHVVIYHARNSLARLQVVDGCDDTILLGCHLVDCGWINDILIAFGSKLWCAGLSCGNNQLQCREINS